MTAEMIQEIIKRATNGEAVAQSNLAKLYFSGQGVEKNYAEAVKWFKKAADQGHMDAIYSLGYLSELGYGTEQNYATAAKLYAIAAEKGHPQAQFNLGLLHEKSQDFKAAYYWYAKAARQGLDCALEKIDMIIAKLNMQDAGCIPINFGK